MRSCRLRGKREINPHKTFSPALDLLTRRLEQRLAFRSSQPRSAVVSDRPALTDICVRGVEKVLHYKFRRA